MTLSDFYNSLQDTDYIASDEELNDVYPDIANCPDTSGEEDQDYIVPSSDIENGPSSKIENPGNRVHVHHIPEEDTISRDRKMPNIDIRSILHPSEESCVRERPPKEYTTITTVVLYAITWSLI